MFASKINFLLILSLFLIFLLSFNNQVNAKRYKSNQIVENKFVLNKKVQLKLPEGKWIVVNSSAGFYYGITSKFYSLVRLENKSLVEWMTVEEVNTAGIYENEVNQAIYGAIFKNKYDGCYERPEYFIVNVYKKGVTHNCLVVDHSDVHKDYYTPDDPESTNADLKKWIRDNNVQIPKIGLSSFHSYFSRLAAGKWYIASYGIDPKVLNAPKSKFLNEETSEYHKNNISNYPDHQKIMKKWVSISAQRHIEFENSIKVIERHKLDLSDFLVSQIESNKNIPIDIVEQINQLNELYKSGALTKDEFHIAKKKLLN